MWKPEESLDDYVVKPAPEVKPPSAVSLSRTGDVEFLKPLVRKGPPPRRGHRGRRGLRPKARYQPLWFRSFVAAGSGALVMIMLVLVSAILVGVNDQVAEPEVATISNVTPPQVPFEMDYSYPLTLLPPAREVARTYRRYTRPVRIAVRKRPLRARLQAEQPTFYPTTLIIYSDNGVIKSRREPWVRSS